jgi:hypothetical protein
VSIRVTGTLEQVAVGLPIVDVADVAGAMTASDVSDALSAAESYADGAVGDAVAGIPDATASAKGLATSTQIAKLDGIAAGAQVNLAVGTTAGTVAAGDDGRLGTLLATLPDGVTAAVSGVDSPGAEIDDGVMRLVPYVRQGHRAAAADDSAIVRFLARDAIVSDPFDSQFAWGHETPSQWALSALTIDAAGAVFPDPFGGRSATKLLETAATAEHFFSIGGTLQYPEDRDRGVRTLEIWVKPLDTYAHTGARYGIRIMGDPLVGVYDYHFDFATTPDGYGVGIVGAGIVGAQSVHEPPSVTLEANGWYRIRVPFCHSNPSTVARISLLSAANTVTYAGNVALGFYVFGTFQRHHRAVAFPMGDWIQHTRNSQPCIAEALDPDGSPVLSFERCNGGTYEACATVDWANAAAPFTLHLIDYLTSERAHTAGDSVIFRCQDVAGTSFYEIALTDDGGVAKYKVRQVKAGGSTLSVNAPTRAGHVPVVRSFVFSGTTVQPYYDGIADGAPQAFVLQSTAHSVCNLGNISGYWDHDVSGCEIFRVAQSAVQVAASAEELMQKCHGFGIEPWRLIALFGQSLCQKLGTGREIPEIVGSPSARVWMPTSYSYGLTGAVTIRKEGLRAVSHGSPFNTDIWGCEVGLGKTLGARKFVIAHHIHGGSGWEAWQPDGIDVIYDGWIARCLAVQALVGIPAAFTHFVSLLGEGQLLLVGNTAAPGNDELVRALVAATIDGARTALSAPSAHHILVKQSTAQMKYDPSYIASVNSGYDLRAAEDPLTTCVERVGIPIGGDSIHTTQTGRYLDGLAAGKALLATL